MPLPDVQTLRQLLGARPCTPAPVVLRVIALGLDTVLAVAVTCLIFFRVVSPEAEDTLGRQEKIWQQEKDQARADGTTPKFRLSPDSQELAEPLAETMFAVFMAYFAGSELVWGGATLGKRVFSLRVARWPSGDPPNGAEVLSRNIVKGISLCWPPLLVVELFPLFSQRVRRAAHDHLAGTIVTGDAPPPPPREDTGDRDEE